MNPHVSGVTDEGSSAPEDNLLAGEFPRQVRKVTLLAGENRKRGTLLGKITTGGKYKQSASASSDGSQTGSAILAHDADATDGDMEVMVYETGDFNELALILGAGHTVDSIRAGLRDQSIFLHRNIPAVVVP